MQEPPAWETVKLCPPIVREALRELVLVLAAALQVTLAVPLPLAGEQVSQVVSLLLAVQAHPLDALTLTLPVPPPAVAEALGAESE